MYWGRGANRPYGLFEIDHIVPLQFGGADHRKNMAVLCPACHRRKSQREAIWGCTVCAVHGVTYDPSSSLGATHGVQCLRQPLSSYATRDDATRDDATRDDTTRDDTTTRDDATRDDATRDDGAAVCAEEEEMGDIDFSAYAYTPAPLPPQYISTKKKDT